LEITRDETTEENQRGDWNQCVEQWVGQRMFRRFSDFISIQAKTSAVLLGETISIGLYQCMLKRFWGCLIAGRLSDAPEYITALFAHEANFVKESIFC